MCKSHIMATGYDSDDYSFIDSVDEYKCAICHCVTKEPTLTSCCGNHYCQSCIDRVLQQGRPCPLCSTSGFEVFLDKKQKRRILSLKVHCTLKSQGCEWTGDLGDLGTHIDHTYGSCGYVRIECSQCSRRIQRRKLDWHKERDCPKRPWKCNHCEHGTTFDKQRDHVSVCTRFPVPCPNSCQRERIERGQLDSHLKQCPLQVVDCEFKPHGCCTRVMRKDMQKHLDDNIQQHLLLSNRHLTKEVALLKKRVEAIETISLVVPVTFTIHRCHSVLQSDEIILVYQQPFLTHAHGYRLQFYCLVKEGKLSFTLGYQDDDMVSVGLSFPKHLTLLVMVQNQTRNGNNLRLRGEFELKSDEVVRISIPTVRASELLHASTYGIQYVVNDTLCCTFDTELS